MYTPWGRSDYEKMHTTGVVTVGTPSHGGVMVAVDVAPHVLTSAAIKRGKSYGSFLAYEEDCDAAIVYYELVERGILLEDGFRDGKAGLFKSLTRWNADYLLERGIEPDPDAYKFYIKNKTDDAMRKAKHPDLVTVAFGNWHTGIPGVIEVGTADGKRHLVTEDSYDKRDTSTVNLLSNLEIVTVEAFQCHCTNSEIPYSHR